MGLYAVVVLWYRSGMTAEPTLLTEATNPHSLAPGVYRADSRTSAYPALRYLADTGGGEVALERFLPSRHIELTVRIPDRQPIKQNPADDPEISGSFSISRAWSESRVRTYRAWRVAWWREAIQNSVDAEATRIDLRCEQTAAGFVVSCSDDGGGMSPQYIEDKEKGFLAIGGSGKTGGGGSTGGFGAAKEILTLPWIQFKLLSSDKQYMGSGTDWRRSNAPERKGVMLEVLMPADFHTDIEHAEHVLARSWIQGVKFSLNGRAIKALLQTPDKVLQEVPGQGTIYEGKRTRGQPPELLVRKNGLWMFSEDLPESAKHTIVVELTGSSTKLLTENRDGLSGTADKLRRALDDMRSEMSSEGKVKSKKSAPVMQVFRGTGKLSGGTDAKKRAAELASAAGPIADFKTGKATTVTLSKASAEQIVALLSQLSGIDMGQSAGEGGMVSAALCNMDKDLAETLVGSISFASQKGLDAALAQLAWQPDMLLLKDPDFEYHIPKKFTPESITPGLCVCSKRGQSFAASS